MTEHGSDAALPQPPATAGTSQHLMAASAAGSVTLEPAASAMPSADVDFLEKAFQLYHDTCLSLDPHSCWDGAVQPALLAALTFHAPDTAALLGDAAVSPEMFHQYALAYIHQLGLSSSPDKLQDLQQRIRRVMRRSNASAEACQSLYTAASAAEQAALDNQLGQLELQVQEAIQSASHKPVSDAAAGEVVARAPEQAAAPDEAALDECFGVQPAADHQTAQPGQPGLTDSTAVQEPEAMQSSAWPDGEQLLQSLPASTAPVGTAPAGTAPATVQAGTAPAGTAPNEVPHKELLLALLAHLKRWHILWKGMGGKGEAGHSAARQAELQMSRSALVFCSWQRVTCWYVDASAMIYVLRCNRGWTCAW